MRLITSKQLFKIFQGEDLEFRITEYALKFQDSAKFEGLIFPHDLNFKDSFLGEISFKNCKFLGDITIKNSTVSQLNFEGCQFKNVIIKGSQLDQVSLKSAKQLQKFHIGSSSLNNANIEGNKTFEALELGCENHIISANIVGNGNFKNRQSTIYICPEKFESMVLKNNVSEVLHIGTIGEYASFEIDNYAANLFLFSNCTSTSSQVSFKDMLPKDPSNGSVCIVNSANILELHEKGLFRDFKKVRKFRQMDEYYQLGGIAS